MKSIQSPLLSLHKNLLHAFSTKEGGYSKTPYTGNNLAFHVGDDLNTVNSNHIYFSKELDYPLKRLIRMDQVHEDSIVVIDQHSDLQKVPQCDAIITNMKNTPLMVMVADCIPILLYDPVKEVIGSVHAGRAGVFKQILPKTIQMMQKTYQSKAEDIQVVLGPSIHQCCYEIGNEIKEEAAKYGYASAIETKNGSHYLSLTQIISKQLLKLHVKTDNVELSPYCTACNNNLFFSYRAENNRCGRFCGLIMLK